MSPKKRLIVTGNERLRDMYWLECQVNTKWIGVSEILMRYRRSDIKLGAFRLWQTTDRHIPKSLYQLLLEYVLNEIPKQSLFGVLLSLVH